MTTLICNIQLVGDRARHTSESSADIIAANSGNMMGYMQQEAEAFFSQINFNELLAEDEVSVGITGEGISYDSIMAKLSEAYRNSLLALTEAAIEISGLPCDGWIRRARDQSKPHKGPRLRHNRYAYLHQWRAAR